MSWNKLLTYISLFGVLIAQLILVSCSSLGSKTIDPTEHPTLVDQSWLTDQPCVAPCWHSLVPGKSSQIEAIAIAKGLSFLDNKNVKLDGATGASFFCIEPPSEICVAMGFEHGMLSNFWIYPNFQITLEQVVNKLGPPDSFFFSYKDPESTNCSLSLFWIKRQMILGHSESQQGSQDELCDLISKRMGKIPKGVLIQGVNYVTSSELEWIIKTGQKPGTGANYTLWSGFSD